MARPRSGDIELDLGRYELRRAGHRVKLEKKPMELLIFLAGRRDQLVSRRDIVSTLWPSSQDPLIDTERNINNIVRKIRTALGDDAEKPRFLETVIGKGYRFVGPMRIISPLFPAAQSTTEKDAPPAAGAGKRLTRDPLAYSEFLRGYRQSTSGDPNLLEEAAQHLMNSVARDPGFALAHATLSYVCAARHFGFDPSHSWLEKAEFHCQRALELDAALPDAHVARAFLLWGPSKNFQHIEASAELKRALSLQPDLPHAHNRLGTIFAHIGLMDHARTMYERGAPYGPGKTISHTINQVYLWNGEYESAREQIELWRSEAPDSKYAMYFALHLAILTRQWEEAERLAAEAARLAPEEPMLVSLEGLIHAAMGRSARALRCMNQACTNPKSFGHAHHTYYQVACIHSLLGRPEVAFEWLERSVDNGFACWPFFLNDPALENLRRLPQFELLVSSLQAKYPSELGLL
ncbi:MAG: winged helix-turn-helix domain-containing protein [Candidatus Korobacteraceae bacterium]